MESDRIEQYYERFKYGEDNFHNLMQFRVRKILLVSTIYDAYILEHDSILSEQIVIEYHQLNLTTIPRIIHVSTGQEAIKRLEKESFDLVITTMHIGEMSPFDLAHSIKEKQEDLAVLLLLTLLSDCYSVSSASNSKSIDKTFLWNGDSGIFLAMIKYAEDKRNAPADTLSGGVRVLIFIEDSIRFYSYYLPLLYKELMEQTQRLISEELNDVNKYFRMKSRPKILLAANQSEATELSFYYRDNLAGIISDMEFQSEEGVDEQAGLKTLLLLKEKGIDAPCLLQSSEAGREEEAHKANYRFIWKKSPSLQMEIREFILSDLGFGDFIFRNENGEFLGKAHSVRDFQNILPLIPIESLCYHGEHNHFSSWLSAHGEFQVARIIKPVQTSDFEDNEELREYLIHQFKAAQFNRLKGQIVEFDADLINQKGIIVRIGAGSLGGKGRGLAFFNALFSGAMQGSEKNLIPSIPETVIIATSEYDKFIMENHISSENLRKKSDEEIKEFFLSGAIPQALLEKISIILDSFKSPLAVRSSGLLEDSQSQPFAGIYQTYMLPNKGSAYRRLTTLLDSIKLVYSSIFLKDARSYLDSLNLNWEEEKMAVIIQELVGQEKGTQFYPNISGTAQSYNYYSISHMEPKDGVAELALGFGHIIAGGGKAFLYCPNWPGIPLLDPSDQIKHSQKKYFYLDLAEDNVFDLREGERATLKEEGIEETLGHGSLSDIASYIDPATGEICADYETGFYPLITFSDVIKYESYPLSRMIATILRIGEQSFGSPVEIEFAVDSLQKEDPVFYLLQIRPLNINRETLDPDFPALNDKSIWIRSSRTMGNGIIRSIGAIVQVRPDNFDPNVTDDIALEIKTLNQKMAETNESYILLGPGRWGSRDTKLGIPVKWAQIDHCCLIVEAGLKDYDIEPSLGSHFLHNIISRNIGYLSIPYYGDHSFLDYDWLKTCKIVEKRKYTALIKPDKTMDVYMDGKSGVSVITR